MNYQYRILKISYILGTNRTMSEYACLVVSNLCFAEKLTVPILMQLDATQNLINLAKSSSDSVQEAAFQVHNSVATKILRRKGR